MPRSASPCRPRARAFATRALSRRERPGAGRRGEAREPIPFKSGRRQAHTHTTATQTASDRPSEAVFFAAPPAEGELQHQLSKFSDQNLYNIPSVLFNLANYSHKKIIFPP